MSYPTLNYKYDYQNPIKGKKDKKDNPELFETFNKFITGVNNIQNLPDGDKKVSVLSTIKQLEQICKDIK